ncbi:protein kinase [Aggregicoccus sp. 17bor-14]|uniref:serine/threonine-protein kinase n=1 Tax=Myxococcaceae TaxID=31 RepID=UPI0012F2929A|nr:protein kinase [Simulacricoccus sp. 17bor-14]MRI87088.1 protein kinase [Aggregicoccus sp. 17bor-14]
MTLAAGTPIGKYLVRRKLAEGGMAEIYLCTARGVEGFEKEVVIKRVRSFLADDPAFVEMFKAEARLASRLNHANVVQIFDFDKHDDSYYLAMEYVRGCSLWELRKRCKALLRPMPPTLVAHIGAEVARGLHYAHRLSDRGQPLQLVHRDVTPHNVLLSLEGAVKLTDFGIAKAGNQLTAPGMLKGKFAYMAPEQARGDVVDARTDIFALGIVLWEMLTGGRLFEGDTDVAVLRAVQECLIVPPARLNPDVPADLDAAVMRALQRDPAARFASAGELERALAQCVLVHAASVDDTDVGEFVRSVLHDGPTQLAELPTGFSLELAGTHAAAPPAGEAAAPAVRAVREPTAVMPGGRGRGEAASPRRPSQPEAPRAEGLPPPEAPRPGVASAPAPAERGAARTGPPAAPPLAPASADEDVHAPTFVLPPRPALSEAARAPTDQGLPAVQPPPPPAPRRRWALLAACGLGLGVVVAGAAALRPRHPASPASVAPSVAARAEEGGAPPAVQPPVAAVSAPSASPEPAEAADAGVDPEIEELTQQPGSLQVLVYPYATVFVDGRSEGVVQGTATFALAPGRHTVSFKHPNSPAETRVATVESGKTVKVPFRARLK